MFDTFPPVSAHPSSASSERTGLGWAPQCLYSTQSSPGKGGTTADSPLDGDLSPLQGRDHHSMLPQVQTARCSSGAAAPAAAAGGRQHSGSAAASASFARIALPTSAVSAANRSASASAHGANASNASGTTASYEGALRGASPPRQPGLCRVSTRDLLDPGEQEASVTVGLPPPASAPQLRSGGAASRDAAAGGTMAVAQSATFVAAKSAQLRRSSGSGTSVRACCCCLSCALYSHLLCKSWMPC